MHSHGDSVSRFDQFYKHYMKHLIDEMANEEDEQNRILDTSGRMNNTTLPLCITIPDAL